MNEPTIIASWVLLQALIRNLETKGVLSREDVKNIFADASETLGENAEPYNIIERAIGLLDSTSSGPRSP